MTSPDDSPIPSPTPVQSPGPFRESRLLSTPIRDLGLKIEGTALEPVIAQFQSELESKGIRRLRPDFHLSTEWGVPFQSITIGIPFYLARPELTAVHAERVGHLEGAGSAELLRYLRHEMGHVVNYAYKLYEEEEWVEHFGSITQPYLEEYRPEPFSQRFVWHLPGWYAQKHPDEDWSETFAIWMTPGIDWRSAYMEWPEARAKLEYCDRTMALLNERDPLVTSILRDEDVSEIAGSLEEYYEDPSDAAPSQLPAGLDGALRAILEDLGIPDASPRSPAPRLPAAGLILRLERDIVANVYRWTGHFPELTRHLVHHLAERARELQQVYPADREAEVSVALTALITALAMNHVFRGSYLP
jgi:hypothetical protein